MTTIDNQVRAILMNASALQWTHFHFTTEAYNECYNLLLQETWNDRQIEDMLASAHANLWHWKKHSDCRPENIFMAYWQIARVAVAARMNELCVYYSDRCRAFSSEENLPAIYRGYAYEISACASLLAKNAELARGYLTSAQAELEKITNSDENNALYVRIGIVNKWLATLH